MWFAGLNHWQILVSSSFVFVVMLAAETAVADFIANGSFEKNSALDNVYNLDNATFNNTVDDATAFGGAEEIDLMTFGGGFGLDPIDGDWHLALHRQAGGEVDAFSFDLTQSIVAGQSYELSFFASANTEFGSVFEPVEIGISDSADSFGTLVYSTGQLPANEWQFFESTFQAPISGDFLTVRVADLPETWAHVDGFTLSQSAIPEPGCSITMLLCAALLIRRRRIASLRD